MEKPNRGGDSPGCRLQYPGTGLDCTSHRNGMHVTRRPEWGTPDIRWPIVAAAEPAPAAEPEAEL